MFDPIERKISLIFTGKESKIPSLKDCQRAGTASGAMTPYSRPFLTEISIFRAFAWDINMPDGDPTEIHSENGYLSLEKDGTVTLTTAMSNGFMTVEEGDVGQNQIKFSLERIGRISFSHDSAVRSVDIYRKLRNKENYSDVQGLDPARRETTGGAAVDDHDIH